MPHGRVRPVEGKHINLSEASAEEESQLGGIHEDVLKRQRQTRRPSEADRTPEQSGSTV